tara:strand:+ start:272 stop:898 length:627 start_codon:yes stop_codon:yes gene_type:complete
MKYYYSTNGVDQNGPLTFEELKREGITAETLIWHKGMNEWQKAGEIPKLKILFEKETIILSKPKTKIPPPPVRRPSVRNSLPSPSEVKNENLVKPVKVEKIIEKPVINKVQNFSWWKFDDEYITGWQYLGRSLVGWLLLFFIIGLYLQAVTAYKRSNSLGNSNSTNNFFKIWGGISMIIGLIPGLGIINIIPHWYLWFSSGPGHITKI